MSHMGLIGVFETVVLGAGLTISGAATGILVATAGTLGLNKVSRFFANKEKEYPQNSWKASACKILKWVFVALSGLTGTSGSALFGASVFAAIQIFSLGTLTPVSIATGIISALILEAYVVKKVVDQSKRLITI